MVTLSSISREAKSASCGFAWMSKTASGASRQSQLGKCPTIYRPRAKPALAASAAAVICDTARGAGRASQRSEFASTDESVNDPGVSQRSSVHENSRLCFAMLSQKCCDDTTSAEVSICICFITLLTPTSDRRSGLLVHIIMQHYPSEIFLEATTNDPGLQDKSTIIPSSAGQYAADF